MLRVPSNCTVLESVHGLYRSLRIHFPEDRPTKRMARAPILPSTAKPDEVEQNARSARSGCCLNPDAMAYIGPSLLILMTLPYFFSHNEFGTRGDKRRIIIVGSDFDAIHDQRSGSLPKFDARKTFASATTQTLYHDPTEFLHNREHPTPPPERNTVFGPIGKLAYATGMKKGIVVRKVLLVFRKCVSNAVFIIDPKN